MRLLGRCRQCDNWFVEDLGPTTPERVAELIEWVPLWLESRRCEWCKSLDVRNDVHVFFEEFTGLTRSGFHAEIRNLPL